jgi:hypothetical protein
MMSGVTDSGDNYIFSLPMMRLSPTPREEKLMYLVLNRGYAMQCDLEIFELTTLLGKHLSQEGFIQKHFYGPMTR